jgi:oligopeptide/dipeptide ABC transporter ATP-binding protein
LSEPILQIRGLSIAYPIAIGTVRAVEKVDLDLSDGEALGLVGESGCGKSTLGLAILRLVRPPGRITAGRILYHERDILAMREPEVRGLRGRAITMAFQNPLTSLNPLYRIDRQFLETIREHEPTTGRADALARAERVMSELGVESRRLYEYPHQLSGGMRQRVMLALGLVMDPDILVADEPTTSLDVIVEAGFIDLLNRLRRDLKLSILLITHNLGMVAEIADRIAVMYAGKIVEVGDAEEVFHRPLHPYTHGLIHCVPNIRLDQEKLATMGGSPPDLVEPPSGCRFHPRCPHAMEICRQQEPPFAPPRTEAQFAGLSAPAGALAGAHASAKPAAAAWDSSSTRAGSVSASHRVACWLYGGGP